MALSDKPGVLGSIGTLGTAVKQATTQEVKRTIENSAEQLGMKEKKEGAPATPDMAAAQEAAKKQSQEVANWLYGGSSETSPAPTAPEKKPEAAIADIKAQLGLETKPTNTANAVEQLGLGTDTKPTASVTQQLGIDSSKPLTPAQQQLQNRLHQNYYAPINQDYHQKLNNPQLQSDTEERQKEAQEEQETPQQRMERQMQEDLIKKKEEEEKKKQIDPAVDMTHNMERNRGSSG